VPVLADLAGFDAVLLFEDGSYANSDAVGDLVAQFHEAGGGVVHATFYWQDTWGNFTQYQALDDQNGCEYNSDDTNSASLISHPVTAGVTSLGAVSYRGGTVANPAATTLLLWQSTNQVGNPDPAIAVRTTAFGRVVGISVLPSYSRYGTLGNEYRGEFHLAFENALKWSAN